MYLGAHHEPGVAMLQRIAYVLKLYQYQSSVVFAGATIYRLVCVVKDTATFEFSFERFERGPSLFLLLSSCEASCLNHTCDLALLALVLPALLHLLHLLKQLHHLSNSSVGESWGGQGAGSREGEGHFKSGVSKGPTVVQVFCMVCCPFCPSKTRIAVWAYSQHTRR